MKALVIGSDGFVAPYLIKELLARKYDVSATFLSKKPTFDIKLYELDVLNPKQISSIIKQSNPDVIFHMAAVSDVAFSFKNPEVTRKVNVRGTKNILDNITKDTKILLVGSSEEYGIPTEIPIKENHPLNPISPYAKSKVEIEQLVKDYRDYKIYLTRSFNHIGPGQLEKFVVSSFAKQIAEIENGKEAIIYVGNLEAKRDFTDVRDVVKAYVNITEKANPLKPYNVCSGKSYAISEILNNLLSQTDKKITIKQNPELMRPSDIPNSVGDNSLIQKETNWKPVISIKTSLKDILNYWRGRL